nr:MAG TPA: hypothetical protein [Bacteriophage sp.]
MGKPFRQALLIMLPKHNGIGLLVSVPIILIKTRGTPLWDLYHIEDFVISNVLHSLTAGANRHGALIVLVLL